MSAVTAEKFSNFEWYMQGLTASSASLEPTIRSTGAKPLDYQDKLGVIAKIETQLAKSVASLVLFGYKSQNDYEYVRNHLANVMILNATQDKKREPDGIAMYHMAWLVARMVIDFALDPELESAYTAKGRLFYAGIRENQMTTNVYRLTWKPYENLMTLALESAIEEANKTMGEYKKETIKEAKL
ncbi:hypothetical protein I2F17_08900 [Acinetobacter sp. B10A]|uniref:hypothetical protein n=1 Tax=Acinetobacter baretiae TaxID=2605383 RepID=UPI001B3C9CAE|nr:hypothetical protein [Acinetobacter baretiae]MBF7685932.1 hypothetical protein [Acinetobacter baretiae]